MSDTTMATNYIYLLQEREFLKTKENIFKVGMTTKQNYERFNQYPKGSILLFQMICINCKNIEKIIITIFKEKFIQRKDIGNEYFQGNYKNMIDIIYLTIKDEKEAIQEEYQGETQEECIEIYKITTYEEWIKYNKISKIIITNKNGEGYLRFKGQLWRKLYDKSRFDYNEDYMENLLEFIEYNLPEVQKMVMPENVLVSWAEMNDLIYHYKHKTTGDIINSTTHHKLTYTDKENYSSLYENELYKFVNVEYDVAKIYQDILKTCYNKTYDVYELKYHEYVITSSCGDSNLESFVFNSLTFNFTPVDELIGNKILKRKDNGFTRIFCIKTIMDINIVDNILNSLINNEIKQQYKKLAYNLLSEQEENQIIFYDYNECLLTTWLIDLLFTINGINLHVSSRDYYDNKLEFKKLIKQNKPRCVIIRHVISKFNMLSIETQIKEFRNLGFKNIIVCQDDKMSNMYNIENYRKYLQDNKEVILNCFKNENNYEPVSYDCDIQYDDNIFYKTNLFLTNYLKWCCIK